MRQVLSTLGALAALIVGVSIGAVIVTLAVQGAGYEPDTEEIAQRAVALGYLLFGYFIGSRK